LDVTNKTEFLKSWNGEAEEKKHVCLYG
jgi:hypothetical protein